MHLDERLKQEKDDVVVYIDGEQVPVEEVKRKAGRQFVSTTDLQKGKTQIFLRRLRLIPPSSEI